MEVLTKRALIESGSDALDAAGITPKFSQIAVRRSGVKFTSALEVMDFAKMMSIAGTHLPKYLRGNVGGCLAISLKAVHWEMDPFEVANKSYEVNDRIGFESQLIHGVIEARAPLQHRLDCSYSGELIYDEVEQRDESTGEKFVTRVLNWRKSTRSCTVVGRFTTGDQREYTSPKISDIRVKNSPLWRDDPDQQLFYYASRSWARKWCPDVLMGVYSREELQADPQLGREGESAGLHARLIGSEPSGSEGHKDGHAASELDQIASEASGPVIETTPEPAKKKKAEKPAKEPKTKTKAKAATLPTNVAQYIDYATQWITMSTDNDELFRRWNDERKMRNDLGVTGDDRTPLGELLAKRREELAKD